MGSRLVYDNQQQKWILISRTRNPGTSTCWMLEMAKLNVTVRDVISLVVVEIQRVERNATKDKTLS